MKVENNELVLTESDVNELRFLLSNLNSPSKEDAMNLAYYWELKLSSLSKKLHPISTPTSNID